MNRKIIIASIILLIILVSSWFFYPSEIYERFDYSLGVNAARCEHYYESCKCYGSLKEFESYPPKYECSGFESCKNVNFYRGEGCG
jgi:hypothetical protein